MGSDKVLLVTFLIIVIRFVLFVTSQLFKALPRGSAIWLFYNKNCAAKILLQNWKFILKCTVQQELPLCNNPLSCQPEKSFWLLSSWDVFFKFFLNTQGKKQASREERWSGGWGIGVGLGKSGICFWHCHGIPVWPWAKDLVSLCFSFPIYKIGITALSHITRVLWG